MKILYFASIKQRIGKAEDLINVLKPMTISEIIEILKAKNKNYNLVFSDLKNIRCSVNYNFVNFNEKVSNKDELAFFPPVTGG